MLSLRLQARMKPFELEQCALRRTDSANELRCKEKDEDFNTCGSCQSCALSSRLRASARWLLRAGHASQRRFLGGVLARVHSADVLENIQNILRVTFGKDFTYTRSRPKPSLPGDMGTWSSDRALDTELFGREMVETWDWFSRSRRWVKASYLLGVLSLCDTALLHMLGNLTSVLLAREKRTCLQFNAHVDEPEEDASSIPESSYSFDSLDHPDLDLLIRANPLYDPVDVHSDPELFTLQACHTSELSANPGQPNGVPDGAVSPGGAFAQNEKECYRDDTESSDGDPDDPALSVVPRASTSLSGVSRHRDFLRGLPVHLAKRILGLLDAASLQSCRDVSQHWRYLTDGTVEDLKAIKRVQNQAMMMQSNTTSGVSAVYARVQEVLVPVREEEKHMHHGDVGRVRRDRGFEAVYTGIRTRTVQIEERNVFCGVYNVSTLLDRDDPFRVAHYGGGQLVAVGSRDRVVRLLDVVTLREAAAPLQGHAGSVRAVLLCEERDMLVSASYDLSIRCWDLKSGVCTMLFRGHQGTIICLDLHGDRLVSGAKDCKVKVWNLETGKGYEKLRFRHHNPVLCVKMDQSQVVSSCGRGLVKVWAIETGSLVKVIDAHQGSVHCLFFDLWHILSGGADGQVMAWSTNCDVTKCLMTYQHPREVLTLTLVFLRVLTGCADGKIRIFNFLTGDCLRAIKAGGQQSPVLSLHTHYNSLVVNTRASLLLFQFAKVRWDYSASAERELTAAARPGRGLAQGGGMSQGGGLAQGGGVGGLPYACVRAERMAQLGSSNPSILRREAQKPALSHHARSLSAPSMRRAQAAQREWMRPATWSDLRGSRRSAAFMDLQPGFISAPPSALCPGGPVSGRSPDPPSRAGHTPRTPTTTSPGREFFVTTRWALSRSERAVRERVRRRGPHRAPTPERVLLTVNANSQLPRRRDLAAANTELNARVRDAWGETPPPPPLPHAPDPAARPSPPRTGDAKRPHTRQGVVGRRSPRPAVGTERRRRPQTAHAISAASSPRRVGTLTTTAAEDVRPPCRPLPRTTAPCPPRHPGRRVTFEEAPPHGKPPPTYNPLDPFRERGAFRLLTDSQLQEHAVGLSQGGPGAESQRGHAPRDEPDGERRRRKERVWRMRERGVPAAEFTREDQVYAPELGRDVYI